MPEESAVVPQVSAETPGKIVQLPCGYIAKDGKIHRDAEIIPMTGLARKSIARDDVRSNPAKVTDVLLLQCLKRIGPVTSINNRVIGDMLVADRDFLLIEIRRVSMGDTVTANTECEKCSNKIEVKFKLDEIPVTPLKDGQFEMKENLRVFRIQNESPHLNAVFRFPKGDDQHLIVPFINKNPVEGNYRIYSACLLEWDSKPGPFNGTFFDRVNVDVLDVIDELFLGRQPGPDFTQKVACPVCTADIEMSFQGSDFLFPLPKRGKQS